ncbi:MAG: TIGR04255 family protein [Terracidiphilus sp.]
MNQSDFHLEKAPIVEAIIAIDIGPVLSDESMTAVEGAATTLQEDYPQSEPLTQVHVQFGFGPGMSPLPQQSSKQDIGRKYVSSDKRQLVVFRRNGFSFSRLPPYQRWENFRDEAKRIWGVYRAAIGPVPIVRFGLRYINRVNIPVGKPVDDFLKLYAEVPGNPDGSLRTINSSYIRVDSMLTEIPAGYLIIQQATLPPERMDLATLSLDFDISVSPNPNPTEEYVWDTLETARRVKNQLFIDSLTPQFLETFR